MLAFLSKLTKRWSRKFLRGNRKTRSGKAAECVKVYIARRLVGDNVRKNTLLVV